MVPTIPSICVSILCLNLEQPLAHETIIRRPCLTNLVLPLCAASLGLVGLGVAGLGSINLGASPSRRPKDHAPSTPRPFPSHHSAAEAQMPQPPKKPHISAYGLNQTAKNRPIE